MTNRSLNCYTPLTTEQIEREEFFEYQGNMYWDDPLKIHPVPEGKEPFFIVNDVEIYIPTDLWKPAFGVATGINTVGELYEYMRGNVLKRELLAMYQYYNDYFCGVGVYAGGTLRLEVQYGRDIHKSDLKEYLSNFLGQQDGYRRLDHGYQCRVVDSTEDGRSTPVGKTLFKLPSTTEPLKKNPKALQVPHPFDSRQYFREYEGFYPEVYTTAPRREKRRVNWGDKLNYTYRMNNDEHNFFRKTKRCASNTYLGLELEVSADIPYTELQEVVQCEEPKQEAFFIMKDDGSVQGKYPNKVELVTVPMSPRKLKQEFKKFMDKVGTLTEGKIDDYVDTDRTLNNGIHIHVSKAAFDSSYHQRKFQMLFNSWDMHDRAFLQDMSQRQQDYFSYTYSSVPTSYQGDKVSKKVRSSTFKDAPRHSSCHAGNKETIEVRIFQGIFEYQHIAKTIDLVHAMVDYSNDVPLSIAGKRWNDHFKAWLPKQNGYLNLKKELKSCA